MHLPRQFQEKFDGMMSHSRRVVQGSPSAVSEMGTLGGPEAVLRKAREVQPLRPAELDARSLNAYSVKGSRPAHA